MQDYRSQFSCETFHNPLYTYTYMIQTFLNAHLISIDQNEEFTYLTKAATDFAKRLKVKKSRIVQVTQLAFDPNIQPEEPTAIEVRDLIISKWKAFPSKCKDEPIPYVRSVMLAALQELAKEVNEAGIIWLTAINYSPFIQATQRETTLLKEFLNKVGIIYHQVGYQSWSIDGNISVPDPPNLPESKIPEVSTYKDELGISKFTDAVSSNGDNSNIEVFATFNNHYTGNINITASKEWAKNFGLIAGKVLTTYVNSLSNSINTSLAKVASSKQLQDYTLEIVNYLKKVGESVTQQTASHNRRSQLLWLKESMYSTSRQTSYRKLPIEIVSLALANDISEMIPPIYPTSVDYFIKECLREASSESESSYTFEQLLSDVEKEAPVFKETLPSLALSNSGRISLLEFTYKLAVNNIQKDSFEQTTGLRLADTLSRQDLAVWLFRELQVRKLIATK